MSKVLLGTTALVAAAVLATPVLSASRIELGLRGYHVGGISYTDAERTLNIFDLGGAPILTDHGLSDYNEINYGSDSEVHFNGRAVLDNGLEVGFFAELELEDDRDVDDDADTIDEVYVQFQGGFGRVQFGQIDGAMFQMHIAAPTTFIGHGVNRPDHEMDPFDPVLFNNRIDTYGDLSGDNIKISYFTPQMNGFQFGASYTPNRCKNHTGYSECVHPQFDRNHLEAAATWQGQFNNVSFGLSAGYGEGEGPDRREFRDMTLGAEIGFGGFTIGGSYRDGQEIDQEETHWDAGVSYETGPWGFDLTYGKAEDLIDLLPDIFFDDFEQDSWFAGLTYDYGPGMQIGFGVQTLEMDRETILPQIDQRHLDDFSGTSVFIENAIAF